MKCGAGKKLRALGEIASDNIPAKHTEHQIEHEERAEHNQRHEVHPIEVAADCIVHLRTDGAERNVSKISFSAECVCTKAATVEYNEDNKGACFIWRG